MGLKLGKLLRNAGTLGTTWMRDQRQAKKKKKKAAQLQEQMAQEAEDFQNRDLGQTAFTGVQADPAMVAAQQQALQRTQQVANEGYTQTDRDAMQQQLRDAARYEQGQRQSLQQDAQARGMGGSGFNIQSQLAAQQAGADRATETATDMAIEGRARSQAANQQVAQMAGGMRDQGFGEQATRAGATDQYGQWRANTQGTDFANLQAARAGTVAQMQAAAAEQESNPNLDYGVNAVANWYSGGLAGGGGKGPATAGGAGTTGAGTTGAGSLTPGGTIDPVTGLAKNMPGAQPTQQPGAAPAPTPAATPSPSGAQQKMQPPGTPAPTPGAPPVAGPQTKAMPGRPQIPGKVAPTGPMTMGAPNRMSGGNVPGQRPTLANTLRQAAAGPRQPMPGAPQQPNPAQPPNPRPQGAPGGNRMRAAQGVMGAKRPPPQTAGNAAASLYRRA